MPTLLQKTEDNGLEIDTIIGDAAYSGKDNLVMANEKDITVVAKLNPMITQGHKLKKSPLDDLFSYNKDADRYICPMGVMSANGREVEKSSKPNTNRVIRYC